MTSRSLTALQKPANDNLRPNRATPTWPWGPEKTVWSRQLSDEERDRHATKLQPILELAAHVPLLREALDWAQKHDVAIMVDDQCKVGGYYIAGTGVVVMGMNMPRYAEYDFDPTYGYGTAVNTLVHEIRHCWQDYYGMIPHSKNNFAKDYIAISLIEADAYAHGQVAQQQYFRHRSENSRKLHEARLKAGVYTEAQAQFYLNRPPVPPQTPDQRADSLAKHFREWFALKSRAGWYGENLRDRIAADLGVKNVKKPDHNFRFDATRKDVAGGGIDTARREDLLRLGKGFDNRNYLARIDSDFFHKKVFRPELARQFYKASKRKIPAVMREIERRQHPKSAKKPKI